MNRDQLHFGQLSWPGSERQRKRSWERKVTNLLRKARLPISVQRTFDHRLDMVSLDQVNNLYLLLTSVLVSKVPGAVVELGCHTGSTTTVLGQILQCQPKPPALHVYDLFEGAWSPEESVLDRFKANHAAVGIPLPYIHQGDVLKTIPTDLPSAIAFAHIDLGVGGEHERHEVLVTHALESMYPRLAPHGVLVLMDYHVPGLTVDGNDSNPSVRKACDAYFINKREKVITLYGGPCSHGFVRKQ